MGVIDGNLLVLGLIVVEYDHADSALYSPYSENKGYIMTNKEPKC